MKRGVIVSAILAASLAGLIVVTNSFVGATQQHEDKGRIDPVAKRVEDLSAIQIQRDNLHSSPLYIQEATVKEMSREEFLVLVGESASYVTQTTFPQVALLNDSSKTITAFMLLVRSASESPDKGHFLLKSKLSIPPNSTFKVAPEEWPMSERVTTEKDGKFLSRSQQPELKSIKSWIPGTASELKITVGLVEFADGSKWTVPPDSTW
jgi:hypothetical protein